MKHRIQQIATRSGLSPATVDRVLHQRGGVRADTARRVHRAIADLDRAIAAGEPPRDFEAGATAAYLVEQWLHDRAGDVLVVGSPAERVAGFRSVLSPARRLRLVADPDQVRALLAGTRTVRAVYASEGAEVVAAFEAEDRNYDVFVAHGLGRDNLELLRAHRISAVLDACPGRAHPAGVQIITPFNAPVS
ncbi:LacI family DNA-binding transcriptional regulator [Actinoplanes sp. HUAS TT8]|uniref:LacI family DNA-binding transcriptional regulator n=1 Tax=Actinoplanes sp. HUAS TT8 TaxID=3447453 RepID=UPI003F51F7F1